MTKQRKANLLPTIEVSSGKSYDPYTVLRINDYERQELLCLNVSTEKTEVINTKYRRVLSITNQASGAKIYLDRAGGAWLTIIRIVEAAVKARTFQEAQEGEVGSNEQTSSELAKLIDKYRDPQNAILIRSGDSVDLVLKAAYKSSRGGKGASSN